MPNDKEIRIRAILDAQAFDKSVDQIQNRLKKLTQESNQMTASQQQLGGKDTVLGKYAQQAFGDFSKESQKQLEQMFQTQRREAVSQRITMREKQQELEKLKSIDKELTKQQRERVENLKEEIQLLKEKHRSTINQAAEIQRTMGQIAPEAGVGAAGGPGFNLQAMGNYRQFRKMGFGQGTSRMLGSLGGPAAIASGIAAAMPMIIRGTSSVANELAEKERNIGMAQGAAMAPGRRPLAAVARGQGIENLMFAPERARAFGAMQQEMDTRRGRDILGGFSIGGALAGAGGGALAGAGFLGVGAIPGAIGGALAGGFGTPMATDKGFRGAVFNTQEYRATLNTEAIQRQRQLEDAYRAMNFRKQMGFDFFEQNRGTFNQFQQRFGTQDAFRPGGFLGQMLQQGIPAEQAMQLAGGMQSAGGVTAGPGQMGDIRRAFMMQQGGLTNAGRMTGVMRGLARGFGEQATDESMRKLFAEAVQAGVDDSKMVEEMRVFADASVKMAQATGMRVEEAAAEISKGMIGGPSAPGMQAALGAHEMRRRMATNMGAGLQFKMAFGQTGEGREMLGGVGNNVDDMLQFMNLDINNISEDNPIVRSLMQKMGVTNIDEFKRRKQEFDIAGAVRRGPSRKRFRDFSQKIGEMSPAQRAEFLKSEEGQREFQEISAELETQGVGLGAQFRQMMSFFGGVGETLAGGRPQAGLTEEEIANIPEALRKPGLKPKRPGEELMEGFEGRGEAQLTTKRMRTQAQDMVEMMKMFTQPAEGDKSPAQMLAQSAENYNAATQVFVGAVETFKDAIADNKAPEVALEAMKDVAAAIERFSRNPTDENRQLMIEAEAQAREDINQPAPKARTGGTYKGMKGF